MTSLSSTLPVSGSKARRTELFALLALSGVVLQLVLLTVYLLASQLGLIDASDFDLVDWMVFGLAGFGWSGAQYVVARPGERTSLLLATLANVALLGVYLFLIFMPLLRSVFELMVLT